MRSINESGQIHAVGHGRRHARDGQSRDHWTFFARHSEALFLQKVTAPL
jgi:hypothetical protein